MKCNQSRPGFELVSPCPFPTTLTTSTSIYRSLYFLHTHTHTHTHIHSSHYEITRKSLSKIGTNRSSSNLLNLPFVGSHVYRCFCLSNLQISATTLHYSTNNIKKAERYIDKLDQKKYNGALGFYRCFD